MDPKSMILTTATSLGVGVAAYVSNKKYGFIDDLVLGAKVLPILFDIKRRLGTTYSVADVFEETVDRYGKKEAVVFEDKIFSYLDVERYTNRVAHWGKSIGLTAGDKVALFMENRPEFLFLWLGLAKIGVVSALINFNLKTIPLMHSISISDAKLLIFGGELTEIIADVAGELEVRGITCYMIQDEYATSAYPLPSFAKSLDIGLQQASIERPSRSFRQNVKFDDMALMVYTSGTTGLPKAATIRHARVSSLGLLLSRFANIKTSDRVYCVLPLYHASGGNLGAGMMFANGNTLVIRRKFSASQFWNDVRKYRCTVIQYIGELCRYLLSVPPSSLDRQHKVRLAVGNGLRPDIWGEFQDRFGIEEVAEFYGATEGNVFFCNHCKDPKSRGNLGKSGALADLFRGAKIVKYNVEEDQLIRGSDGFVLECKPNEVGELVSPIVPSDPAKQFDGYYGNSEATNKKILRNMFKKGDMYFRTGDLVKRDSERRWHFVDRIGDTFRWKGENVSTTEVADVISKFPGIKEVNIYGIEIPGREGRACMAALVCENVDFTAFAQYVKKHLASYAIPLFLRELPEMDITGTFKIKKTRLIKEGVDMSHIKDPLWYFTGSDYHPLTLENYHEVLTSSKL